MTRQSRVSPLDEAVEKALREFADFIVAPTVAGLDDDTLLEVYLEANARADQIAHQQHNEREENAMAQPAANPVEPETALAEAIRESLDLGGDAEDLTKTVRQWFVELIEEESPHAADEHPEGTCGVCDFTFALTAALDEAPAGGN